MREGLGWRWRWLRRLRWLRRWRWRRRLRWWLLGYEWRVWYGRLRLHLYQRLVSQRHVRLQRRGCVLRCHHQTLRRQR